MRTTRTTRTARVTGRRVAAAATLLLVMAPGLAGCGGDEVAPIDRVPALGTQLELVDRAVGAGDHAQARTAVEDLVAQVAQAQVDGELSDEQAQRIVAAARSVLENLPTDEAGPAKGDPDQGGSDGDSEGDDDE